MMAAHAPPAPPLPLERYAELSAQIDAGIPRDQALAQAGLRVDQWLLIQEFWLQCFASEANARIFESSKQFQKSYIARRAQLAKQGVGRVPTKAPTSQPMSAPTSSGARPMPPREVSAPLQQGYGANAVAEGPRLTLPQFASLCAELAFYPNATDEVRRRYGFDEPSLARENQEWQWRFDQDRTLFERYSQLFRQYRDWLLGAAAQQAASLPK